MCNRVHRNNEKIPTKGVGYKIFLKTKKSYAPMLSDNRDITKKYKQRQTGWIHWRHSMRNYGHGFCIFLSRAEAERCMADFASIRYKNPVVLEIQYKEGLGAHRESGMVDGKKYRIAIVKRFYCKELIEHSGRKYPLGALDPKDKGTI